MAFSLTKESLHHVWTGVFAAAGVYAYAMYAGRAGLIGSRSLLFIGLVAGGGSFIADAAMAYQSGSRIGF